MRMLARARLTKIKVMIVLLPSAVNSCLVLVERVEKIFQLFDTDHSNDIDAKEFQQLAFQLGETLTKEEVAEALSQIDKNKDGVISFDEFYDWWSSAEHTEVSGDSERAKQLRVLKMKLRSQSYMRTVARLVEKVNQKAAAQELGPLSSFSFI